MLRCGVCSVKGVRWVVRVKGSGGEISKHAGLEMHARICQVWVGREGGRETSGWC